MLRSVQDLEGYAIGATDGKVGHVKDFYFDDKAWIIRYLVVETGSWLSSRKVLISPISISRPEWAARILPVSITKEQIKSSPDIDTDKPVSRQYEVSYLGYYGYPYYWGGAGVWGEEAYPGLMISGVSGIGMTPNAIQREQEEMYARAAESQHDNDNPRLRSCDAVTGYHIQAKDGEIGHVQGFLVDEQTWAIRYLIVDTSNWWIGHQVLIAPQWIQDVSWPDSRVTVNLSRQAVKDAPPYDPLAELDRARELGIYRHYGLPAYWADEAKQEAALSRR
jgi:sporulation protein YlmC with PRC-barrel domain